MNNKTGFKVLSGTIAGIAMGFAAATFLRSKPGQQLAKDMRAKVEDFYDFIEPELAKAKNFTRQEYHAFIDEAGARYGKAKKLSEEKISALIKEAKKSWKEFVRELEE